MYAELLRIPGDPRAISAARRLQALGSAGGVRLFSSVLGYRIVLLTNQAIVTTNLIRLNRLVMCFSKPAVIGMLRSTFASVSR